MTAFRDPFDDEVPDYPAIKSGAGGAKGNWPVIAAGKTVCVHCGGDPEFRHPCIEEAPK
jgi:hypothetical protein